jgi:hypothetical protein
MSAEPITPPPAPAPQPAPPRPLPAATGNPIVSPERAFFKAAWLAIVLGIAIEGLVLVATTLFGGTLAARPVTADLAQKVSWSLLVCVALAFARTASRATGALMGIAGLLAGPAAFALARGLHKGVAQALGLVATGAGAAPGPPPWLIGTLKGFEYALLGVAVAWIARKSWGGVGAHAGVGAVAGLLFGVPILLLSMQAAPTLAASALAARAVNELLFPVGCALVLYASDTLGKRLG